MESVLKPYIKYYHSANTNRSFAEWYFHIKNGEFFYVFNNFNDDLSSSMSLIDRDDETLEEYMERIEKYMNGFEDEDEDEEEEDEEQRKDNWVYDNMPIYGEHW
jgi:hypothetical protein